MLSEILGQKIGMSQIFTGDGSLVPVTIIKAGPCQITQKKNKEKDGYIACQIGLGFRKKSRVNKPLSGHLSKSGGKPTRFLREIRLDESVEDGLKEIDLSIFKEGDAVNVTGVTKGKGFAGVMKRHGMAGAPGSRGAHESFRHVGSLAGGRSSCTRVWPGKRLPGRMGGEKKTVLNLQIVKIEMESNHIFLRGAIPGANGGLLRIKKTNRKQ